MGVVDKTKACFDTGLEYGAQGAVLGGTIGGAVGSAGLGAGAAAGAGKGAQVGFYVGGIYGCFKGAGITAKDIGNAAAKSWRFTKRIARRSASLVAEIFGLADKPKKRQPPPTTDEAMALLIRSFEVFPGGVFHMEGSDKVWRQVHPAFIFHPSVLMDLYGPGGAQFDPEGLYKLLWGFWARTLNARPHMDPQRRMVFTILRVGDFLVHAPAEAHIERWPISPPTPVSPGELARLHAPPEPEKAFRSGEADPPPEMIFWGVMALLTTRALDHGRAMA